MTSQAQSYAYRGTGHVKPVPLRRSFFILLYNNMHLAFPHYRDLVQRNHNRNTLERGTI